MTRARARNIAGYSERHHIVPRCLGGGDAPENIVRLSPEEHYVAHQLLVKMYPRNKGLVFAAKNMTLGNSKQWRRRNNKLYGWLRRRHSESMKGFKHTEETKKKLSEQKMGNKSRKGLRHSEETKQKMSKIAKNRPPRSEEYIRNMSLCKVGKKTGPRSEETKRKQSVSIKAALAAKRQLKFLDGGNYKEGVI